MIKAIQTKYKGRNFRSRLEARWAVFFQEMGYDWDYEVEGFVLENGEWYLPDFVVRTKDRPDLVWYYEIKPRHQENDDKYQELKRVIGNSKINDGANERSISLLNGSPYECFSELHDKMVCPRCGGISKWDVVTDADNKAYFNCEMCVGSEEVVFDLQGDYENKSEYIGFHGINIELDVYPNTPFPNLVKADCIDLASWCYSELMPCSHEAQSERFDGREIK